METLKYIGVTMFVAVLFAFYCILSRDDYDDEEPLK